MKSPDFSTDESLAALRAFYRGDGRRLKAEAIVENLRHDAIVEALGALAAVDVEPIIFKGTALAYTVYQRPELRPRCDTDLFLPEGRDDDVKTVMERLGYERVAATSGKWIRHQYSYSKVDSLGFTQTFDFHRRLSDPVLFSTLYDYASLFADSKKIEGLGRVAGSVDSVIIACVHQIAHHASESDPLWLYDLDRLLFGRGASFWHVLRERAEAKKVASLVEYGVKRAAERWGTRIAWDAGTHDEEFARHYLRWGRSKAFRVGADLAHLPGWRARAEYLGEHLFPPAEYILAKYGENRRARLPALYLRRIFNGWRRIKT